jgi:hypothetical protein
VLVEKKTKDREVGEEPLLGFEGGLEVENSLEMVSFRRSS